MATDHRATLRNIRTFPSLIRYLRDEMDWPIDGKDFEELTFEYTPEELGIDTKHAAKIEEIKRLRPLSANQPFGIFFVKFELRRLPVVALREILRHVVFKKRASANSGERKAWAADDLLFVSNFGEAGDQRQISFAHFSTDEAKDDLPTLKVLGWDNLDTPLHLDDVAEKLTKNLAWPANDQDADAWRKIWRSAFSLRHREVITTSRELSIQLAHLARRICNLIKTKLAIETKSGPLTKLMRAFQEALVHDLDADGFADMYAQTIAYGLLSARVTNPRANTADGFAAQIPVTNPFLKELMETFLHVGGRKGKMGRHTGIDFDELGVSEVVELLDDANMEAVIRDFGDKNPQEDPVIHFYELFLKEYDAARRMQRGVFYTPRPVVSYIVRSVHELLQTEFGLADGLADVATWGEMASRDAGLTLPEGVTSTDRFVSILDPATGTGTFLVEAIEVIHGTLVGRWKREGQDGKNILHLWNEYVPKHLLPRLHGYELLMAPYAIAHLKIGLKLHETGYRFESHERARIYLTNALEPAHDFSETLQFAIPALAHEAQAVNEIKRSQRFTVVIGNPPYSLWSQNLSATARTIVDAYRYVAGHKIKEKGALQFEKILQDDYIKFFRVSQAQIDSAGCGILGLVTNHSFIDNPTLRGMRHSLLTSFPSLLCVNLHGNSAKKERAPDGTDDVNVFDIKQGVAISLGVREGPSRSSGQSTRLACDLWGSRESKYESLARATLRGLPFHPFTAQAPAYLLKSQEDSKIAEYEPGWKLPEVFRQGSMGVVTARDHIAIGFDDQVLTRIAREFRDSTLSDAKVCEKLEIPLKKGWDVARARAALRQEEKTLRNLVQDIDYRPFDTRRILYHRSLVWGMSWPTMQHVLGRKNVGLSTTRSIEAGTFRHVFCSRKLVGHHFVSLC